MPTKDEAKAAVNTLTQYLEHEGWSVPETGVRFWKWNSYNELCRISYYLYEGRNPDADA